jgi:hypothetical protein
VGDLAEDLAFRNLEALSDAIEPACLSLRQSRLATRTVAIDPGDVVTFLAGGFHQLSQEAVFVIG